MTVYVMKTDGGSHPPEKWAEVTASQIVQIAESAPEGRSAEARALRDKIVAVLTDHHGRAQDKEKAALAEHGHARLGHDLDPSEHIDDALPAVVAAANGTSFAEHFARPDVQDYLRRVLHKDFGTAMHIERSWHADRNPDAPEAAAFRGAHHPGIDAEGGVP